MMTRPCASGLWKWTALVLIATSATVAAQVAPYVEVISAWPSAKLYYQETLTLTCHGGGDPAPTFSWSRDSGSLPPLAVVDGTAGTLTLVNTTDADSGVYTCTADNGVGTAVANINVTGCPDISTCPDSNPNCASWAASEQCKNNPRYMFRNCRLSCNICFPNLGAHCKTIRRGRSWDTWECYNVTSVPRAVQTELNLDRTFYQKYLHAYGIPILGSSLLPDDALRRACYDVLFMLADRRDLRDSYYNFNGRVGIMAESEVTLNIPEHSSLDPFFNQRARGLGATVARPISTGAEENLLCYSTDRYRVEDIFMSELAHGIDLLGCRICISDFKPRLQAAYRAALANGLWANTYAAANIDEYWAEAVQSFFNVNHERTRPDGIHNHVNTRAELQEYDPALYSIVDEIFPCGNFPVKRCERDYANHTMKMDCLSKNHWRKTVVGNAVWGQTLAAIATTQVSQTPAASTPTTSTTRTAAQAIADTTPAVPVAQPSSTAAAPAVATEPPAQSSSVISDLTLDHAWTDHLTVFWTVVGSQPIWHYRLRYQRTDGSTSYQDLSPAPTASATSATLSGLLPDMEYTIVLTSYGMDDRPNGVIRGTYRTDSIVANVECEQDSMTLSIPLAALRAVDLESMHLLDPSCGATVEGDAVKMHTSLQGCGTRQETSGEDHLIFYNEAIANQVAHENGAMRGQPINMRFHCEFLRRYDVSQGEIMYHIPSSRIQIVDANNTFTLEMHMYTSADFNASYEASDFPIQVTPSDRLNFGLSVTSPLDNLEVLATDCVSTPTTDPNDSPRVNIIEDSCEVDETLQKENDLSNDKALYYSVDAFTFPNAAESSLVYFHCTMILCFKDDPDSRCRQGCNPARRRRAVSDGTEARVRRETNRDHKAEISQGPFRIQFKEKAGPAGFPLGTVIGVSVGVAGVMVLLTVAAVLVKKRYGVARESKKGMDTVGLDNYTFQPWEKMNKAVTAYTKA
ncbi:uncharacterized protein LOC118412473 isoform X1 [Branchiostoma floridae]|uniref:Uncharacterized protein LOC118412473 isoform X1 n=1 Tax=Branchiostoma floridae TaxID=7739 RepID=A0A9J7KWU5_BRAFL|nr:uncharacterized protein LOC118412473 isoform X1 [Branchiostoma floridae]